MAKKVKKLPARDKVKAEDAWDLSSLFANDAAWEESFAEWEGKLETYGDFRGTLAESASRLRECLDFDSEMERVGDRLGCYAMLRYTEDTTRSTYQAMRARFLGLASRAAQASSFIRPELLSIKNATMKAYLADDVLADYHVLLKRLLRFKPHTLSSNEEKLLAMQTEMAATARQVFGQLTDADLRFGTIKNEKGDTIELGHASYMTCLYSAKRGVRRKAFEQYYTVFEEHANTLAATLGGAVQRDIYDARARKYDSALEAALFPDNVPPTVYDNLIATIHRYLPTLYRYFDVRRRAMKIKQIHHYDTYVPIISDLQTRYSWERAVTACLAALRPLGDEYCSALESGLRGRWCDRYPNRGKQSGAFSSGTFDSEPYILMNYEPTVLDHVFTLAHEAGHSMHSYFSNRHQPFQYHNYTIFVAEVASTFNEQFLSDYMMSNASNRTERAYYINREIDAMRGTIFRQTMFAEFEKIIHALAEENEPITLDRLREEYGKLLRLYFGPEFTIDERLSLECLRIPHFYRAFYVYKYATGMSAAIALAERVKKGGETELNDYLGFLKGGRSQDPLDLLRGAGVDMETPTAIETAMDRFETLVDELKELL